MKILKDILLEIIKTKNSINWSFHDVKKALNMSKRKINDELLAVLQELETEGVIYQDEKGNSLRNIIEIKILKNRNRCIGGVTYKFNHIIGKVEEFKSMIPMPMPFKESNLIID